MTKEEKVLEIIKRLSAVYPHPRTALVYNTPFELLIATIMSAQTTDKLVNTLTPELFKRYPTPATMAKAPVEEIATLISKVNFAFNKAKNIKASSEIILKNHGGELPQTM
jgi:endonuclease III